MESNEAEIAVLSDSDSEDGFDERKHSRLLDAITSLDGKNISRHLQRTLPSNDVSEFNFSRREEKSKIRLRELVETFSKDSVGHDKLKKQLSTARKRSKVVAEPLPTHQKEKIDRSVAYKKTSDDLKEWYPIIQENRQADQLIFPLQQPSLELATTDQFVKKFQPRTPLEMEVAALLNGSQYIHKDNELSVAEEKALSAMSLEEAKERHAELQKYRALLSYQEAKARWKNRIKSKSYHRILRKERMKKEHKTLEDLQKSDPEGYLNKLKLVDEKRIRERMSLKHRGGSKYSKKQMMYAKYDARSRQTVQDMAEKGRELKKKPVVDSDSDSDNAVADVQKDSDTTRGDNPWMSSTVARTMGRHIDRDNVQDIEIISEYSRPEALTSQASNITDSQGSVASQNVECQIVSEKARVQTSSMVDTLSTDDEKDIEEVFCELKKSKHEKKLKQKVKKNVRKIKKVKKVSEKARVQTSSMVDTLSSDDEKDIEEIFSELEKSKHEKKLKQKVKKNVRKIKKVKKVSEKARVQTSSMVDTLSTDDEKDIEEIFSELEKSKHEKKSKHKVKKNVGKKKKEVKIHFEGEKVDKKEASLIDETLDRRSNLEEIEADYSDDAVENEDNKDFEHLNVESMGNTEKKETEIFVDPNKIFTKDSVINKSEVPEAVKSADGVHQRMTIAEAFADDDVVNEFIREKADIIEHDKPKDIDLTLPGWGQWSGTTIAPKKRNRFLIRAPRSRARRDRHLGNVVISEAKDAAIAKHQVSNVPFPFKSVKQFEQSIRTPIGKTWLPETAYKQLVKPRVVTKLGHIIEPIDKSEVFSKQKAGNKRTTDISFDDSRNSEGKKFAGHK